MEEILNLLEPMFVKQMQYVSGQAVGKSFTKTEAENAIINLAKNIEKKRLKDGE